ncbi:MAG: 30S ribosomal protein S20 [Desulfobacteraceae bacterium]
MSEEIYIECIFIHIYFPWKGVYTLANHKSALKRAIQNEGRRMRNKTVKTRVKNAIKDIRSALAGTADENMTVDLNKTKSIIDKAAKKGVIHKNTAARKISRLSKLVANQSA